MTRIVVESDGQTCTIERDEDEMEVIDILEAMIIPALIGATYSVVAIKDAMKEIAEEV